jgi:hypothetical protein
MDMLGYQILVLPVTSQRKNLMLVCKYVYLFLYTLIKCMLSAVDPETLKIQNSLSLIYTRQLQLLIVIASSRSETLNKL